MRIKDWSLKSKGLLLVSVPLIFELVFVSALLMQLRQAELETQRETAAKNMIIVSQSVLSDIYQAAVLLMRFRMSHDLQDSEKCSEYLNKSAADLKTLEADIASDPSELPEFQAKRELIQSQLKGMAWRQTEMNAGRPDPLSTAQKVTHYREMSDVVEYFGELAGRQRQLAATRADAVKQSRQLVINVVATGLIGNLILGIAGALLFSQWILARVGVLSENALRLSRSEKLIPPIVGSDEIAKLDGVFHSMASQLTEAMDREKAVIDNAPDFICSVTSQGLLARVNPSVVAVLRKPAEELVGSSCKLLLGEHFPPKGTETSEWKFDSELHGMGTEEPISISWTANWSDVHQQYYCVGRDTTMIRKLEKYKRELMDMVSHDLRTPLTSIRMSLELTLEEAYGPIPESLKKKLTATNANVGMLINLVNELLDLYRSESGSLPLHKEPADASEIIESVTTAFLPLAEKRRVRIACSAPSEIVSMDRSRIEQVLANLIGNAIRYSPDDSTIEVKAIAQDAAVEFQVIDKGRGVPDEMKEAIFERFRQADQNDALDRKGTGLGLAIAKAIVDAHEGTIGVHSQPGQGSTFWFRIPRAAQPSELLISS